ncbi:L,D-transpeptidase [Paenibacillus agricola]|uniref:L,D-transpeptidase n=1 Tax=Paenibacillus agricola TaxID=2716264 RepID=A0ABX0IXN6_9BACL|nr:L,D-transpeptidase [Paenibacillus agricola]NHN28296.1 L,D-transpeptidase [Paenibacillus agricola]
MNMYRIIIDLSDKMLYVLNNNVVTRGFPIGIGKVLTETPIGNYTIINKVPHPGGPFGAFWMGLSRPHYGIHGTNNPASIGTLASHGCVRMYNQDVLALSSLVAIGTPVAIRK